MWGGGGEWGGGRLGYRTWNSEGEGEVHFGISEGKGLGSKIKATHCEVQIFSGTTLKV